MELTSYSVEGTDRFVHRLGEFYPTGIFSDLIIYTADQALKESKEAQVFEIKDEHPRIVEAMIRSFYGLSYDINQSDHQMCPMLFNVKVYSIADRFQVEYLKIQAKLTFVTLAQDHWNSDEFLTAAFEAYKTTPKSDRGLRDVVVAVCQKHRRELREKQAFEKLVVASVCVYENATLESLYSIFQQCDDRPTKRRKATKGGPRSLTQENGVSETGIPQGYIPLARLTLRIKPSNTSAGKYKRPYDLNLSTSRVPVLLDVRSVHFLDDDLNHTPQPESADGEPNRMELELSSLDEEELLIYPCEDLHLFDLLGQLQAASKLPHVDRFSTNVPIACYQAHLCALPDGATFTLETVLLWSDSIEPPALTRLTEADMEAFTRYVLQKKCVRPSALTKPHENRDKMLGTPQEWSPRDFYKNVHVPKVTESSTNIKCPDLKCKLFPFQRRAVRWLLQREGREVGPNGEIMPMEELSKSDLPASFNSTKDADGRTYYFSHLFMILTTNLFEWYDAADNLKGGILAEEMGLGKTVEMIALISLNTRASQPIKTDPDGLRPTGATLIITPPAILEQWKQELKEHAPTLRVHHYNGIKRGRQTTDDMIVDELAEFDVVLTTYNVIAKEIHYVGNTPQRSLRHEKRFVQRKTPLVRLSWWRVCLDEAQMIESGVSNAAKVARLIPREIAWAVTGTPLRRNIDDLFGLLLFLHYEPFCFSAPLWRRLCLCFGPVLAKIINTIALRHRKGQLLDELRLPPQKRIVITTPFTAIEEQKYAQLFEQMCEECGLNAVGAPLRGDWDPEDPLIVEKMHSWLTRLRQACLYSEGYSQSRNLGSGSGPLRTVAQVLEVMTEANEAAIRTEERSLLLSQLRRGQLLENAKRRQEALVLWQTALDHATQLVEDSREQLRLLKIKGATGDNNGDALGDQDQEDKDLDNNSRLGQCRLKLRAALEVQHIAVFFTANAYYQIKSDPNLTQPDSDEFKTLEKREDEAYEAAKVIRKEMLTDISRKVERYMKEIKNKARDKEFVNIPKMKPNLYSKGVESYNLLCKFEDFCDALNKHAEQYKEWRDVMAKLVSQSLIDQEEEAKLEGDEYERSTKHQDEMYVYMEALRSMYSDRLDALTGHTNTLISHEVKAGIVQALKGEGPSPQLFLKIMETRSQLMPDPDLGSLRSIVSDLRKLLTSLEWQAGSGNSRARAEHEIVEMVLKNAGQMIAEQLKVTNKLNREVEMFRDTMNNRLEYYRHLQQISDTVAPYDEESAGKPLDEYAFNLRLEQEGVTEGKIASLKSKARYLLHLRDDASSDSNPRECIVCRSTFEVGVLTITYKPQELVAQEEKTPVKLDHEGHSQNAIYSDISSGHLNEIKKIDLEHCFGVKIDTLARHILWLREHDPGAKSIIFSQYGTFASQVQSAFKVHGIVTTSIDSPNGVEKFKTDPAIECFCFYGKAQSSGLNLTVATHVFLCEPLINTAIELQVIARVHRIGQNRPTTVWMYLVSGTVEESIYEISVTRRLAHIMEKEKQVKQALLKTPADGDGVTEEAIESANSMELQDATLTTLMQRGSVGGELVKKDDLWQCIFGNTKQKDSTEPSAEAEREVGRFLRGEAAEQRIEG
ncbi:Helicase, C-terminal [Penicillium italicum]|uniref:Helicase, C-terminal n=1 Tax=Penicillium italicum TaxID=40296 RepID=A0A0A2LC49_PENIT|nr:Helicase, C-terminal [Penicillium italicum]